MDYKKMTRAQRKVAIAKEVISNINIMKIRAHHAYVSDSDSIPIQKTSQQVAEKAKKKCTVCARGAMLLCKVAKYNNYDFLIFGEGYMIGSHDTTMALKDAFSETELELIERAFERNYSYSSWGPDNDADRLLAIMQNIVDHNGKFKPSVEYVVEKV